MPSCPRSEIVREGKAGVYHVWSRCVRRAFLCGIDPLTNKDYSHRRDWICDFQQRLAALFGIEVGFHAELSNHLHLLLRARPDVVKTWTDEEVIRRMMTVFRLVKSKDGQTIRELTDTEVAAAMSDPERIVVLRKRISSVSSFMQALCEHIALRANREDDSSGSFWESRFRARSLENESAILVCGIYIDLNQIRAGETLTPEDSTHTSAYDRIEARKAQIAGTTTSGEMRADGWLCELTLDQRSETYVGATSSQTPWRASDKGLLSIALEDYLELLDWTGRTVREDKKGAIPWHLTPILDRLGINQNLWTDLTTKFDSQFSHVVGTAAQVVDRAKQAGRQWYQKRARCQEAFG
jgi:hypothetical protein